MTKVIAAARGGFESAQQRVVGRYRDARARWHWIDHLGRAFDRYREQRGDRMAAALTYYGFLSLFPLLSLAYALLGYAVGVSERARRYLIDAVDAALPGLSDQLPLADIAAAKRTAGLIGLGGLLFIGLRVINSLRESLREIWCNDPDGGGSLIVKKLWDVGTLVFLGLALILSVAAATTTTAASRQTLEFLGWDSVPGAGVLLALLSFGVAVAFDTLIFLVLFSRVSGTRAPWRTIIRGALFGALGFELMKMIATLLIKTTTDNAVYASFAVIAGLLVWINFVCRFVLFAAAWTATRRVVMHADEENPEHVSCGTPIQRESEGDDAGTAEPAPSEPAGQAKS